MFSRRRVILLVFVWTGFLSCLFTVTMSWPLSPPYGRRRLLRNEQDPHRTSPQIVRFLADGRPTFGRRISRSVRNVEVDYANMEQKQQSDAWERELQGWYSNLIKGNLFVKKYQNKSQWSLLEAMNQGKCSQLHLWSEESIKAGCSFLITRPSKVVQWAETIVTKLATFPYIISLSRNGSIVCAAHIHSNGHSAKVFQGGLDKIKM